MRILVTGSTGMLGLTLVHYLKLKGYNVICHGHKHKSDINFDLTNLNDTRRNINYIHPDVIINLVALTDVEECEKNLNKAKILNCDTVKNIVLSSTKSIYLIHISTDHVYDNIGESSEDEINLKNNYSLTKFSGELHALKMSSTIFRCNFFGHSNHFKKKSFSDWIINNINTNSSINVFNNVMISPLLIDTLCKYIELAMNNKITGIYNVGSHGGMSKANIAKFICKKIDNSFNKIISCRVEDSKLIAYRPKDMRMKCNKFQLAFGVKLPNLKSEIGKLLTHYSDD